MSETVQHQRPARVVLLTAQGPLAHIAQNAFAKAFPDLIILTEQPESKRQILARRRKLLGAWTAASQAAAGLGIRLLLRRTAARVAQIAAVNGLDAAPPKAARLIDVGSVNSDACRAELAELAPDVVAVYGTRLISRATLECCAAPFINYHAGITPKYRGQHPGYWALANGDTANAGITIHLVDTGVDTGDVIRQARVALDPSTDTIATYQYVQMATALPHFLEVVSDAAQGQIETTTVDLPSRNWFPPTVGQYLANGLSRGVW